MSRLEKELGRLAKNRATQRKARARHSLTTLALVGYTNAGKSTLLNRLTEAHVLVEDRLFSTLDPATRRLRLPGGETVLLSDTVGFVSRLPHQLVESFRSTLEEAGAADLLVHVVDAAAPEAEAQIAAVETVLREIHADAVPQLLVLNKADIAAPDDLASLRAVHPDAVVVSAVAGTGITALLDRIGARLRELAPVMELVVPYVRGDVLAALHRDGEVLVEVHAEAGTRVRARVSAADATRFAEFVVPGAAGDGA
jgi:GTP-binding protein HflX